jgi:hypothetical protein
LAIVLPLKLRLDWRGSGEIINVSKFSFVVLAALALTGCSQTTSNVVASSPASTASDTFAGTRADVIRLAIKAIQSKGWKLDQVNESVGIVSFETAISMGSWSGIRANLILEDTGQPNLFRVTGTAKQNLQGRQMVALDIGDEAQGVVREAVAAMRSIQPSNDYVPPAAPPPITVAPAPRRSKPAARPVAPVTPGT